jgi:hypothetical protein
MPGTCLVLISLRGWDDHIAAGRMRSLEKLGDIENRTRDLPSSTNYAHKAEKKHREAGHNLKYFLISPWRTLRPWEWRWYIYFFFLKRMALSQTTRRHSTQDQPLHSSRSEYLKSSPLIETADVDGCVVAKCVCSSLLSHAIMLCKGLRTRVRKRVAWKMSIVRNTFSDKMMVPVD